MPSAERRKDLRVIDFALALTAAAAVGIMLAFSSGETLTVVVPLVCTSALFVIFALIVWKRSPPSQLGLVYGLVVFAYGRCPTIIHLP